MERKRYKSKEEVIEALDQCVRMLDRVIVNRTNYYENKLRKERKCSNS